METQDINNWVNDFTSEVQALDQSEPRIFVALSRKMPRLLDATCTYDSPEECNFKLNLFQDHIVTEHAIPFIAWNSTSNPDTPAPQPVILDDIIIHGHALHTVVAQLESFTDKKILLEVICQAESSDGETLVDPKDLNIEIVRPFPSRVKDYKKTVEFFTSLIQKTQLPVDVEFPIIHLPTSDSSATGNAYDEIKASAEERYGDSVYELSKEPGSRNFTILLSNSNDILYNNDFAKIRVFEAKEELRITAYAPNIIEDRRLTEKSLFLNTAYAAIWEELLDKVGYPTIPEIPEWTFDDEDRKAYHRAMRIRQSLVVFANYMFSLSTLIGHKDLFEKYMPNNGGRLFESDLNLLLGKEMTQAVMPHLENLISGGEQTTRLWSEVSLPNLVTPDELKDDYVFLSTVKTLEANSLETALRDVFSLGYELKASFTFVRNPFKPYVPVILETFTSLMDKPSRLFRAADAKIRINKTVDAMIDGGFVIPCYYRLRGKDGRYYWRRYFRGSLIISNFDGLQT